MKMKLFFVALVSSMVTGSIATAARPSGQIEPAKLDMTRLKDVPGLNAIGIAACDKRDLETAGGFQPSLPTNFPMANEYGVALYFKDGASMSAFAANYLQNPIPNLVLCPKISNTTAE